MAHLYLLFLVISLMTALLTAGIYLFLYQKYKLDVIRYYLYHLAATIVMVFFVAFNFYLYLNMGVFNNRIKILFGYTSSLLLFSAPVIYTNPVFSRLLTEKKNTKKVKGFFLMLSLLSVLNGVYIFLKGFEGEFTTLQEVFRLNLWLFVFIWFGASILFFSMFYSFGLLLLNYNRMDDPVKKLSAKYLIIFAISAYILAFFDYEAQNRQLLNEEYPVGIFLQPITLMIFSAISLLVLYQAKKLYVQKSSSIPEAFILKYKITDREVQIIEMIIGGLSNKEIASKLFLSPSTVRNHISHIFEKSQMPTRGKLIHFIKNTGI